MNYYYRNGEGAVIGPVSEEKLRQLSASGKLPDSTQVRQEATKQWFPLPSILRAVAAIAEKKSCRWHWLITAGVVVAWGSCALYNEGQRPPSHVPTADEAARAKLEAQWESVVRSRRQKEKDFEERTRPR